MLREYDVFKLKKEIPDQDIEVGAIGVILMVYNEPAPAYEVEFTNSEGITRLLATLTPDYIQEFEE